MGLPCHAPQAYFFKHHRVFKCEEAPFLLLYIWSGSTFSTELGFWGNTITNDFAINLCPQTIPIAFFLLVLYNHGLACLYFVPSEVIISILSILLFLIVIWYLLSLMSGLPLLKCLFLCISSVLSVWKLLWFFPWESAIEISIVGLFLFKHFYLSFFILSVALISEQ